MLALSKSYSVRLPATFFLLVVLCALVGCHRNVELHVAYYPWIGYETLSLADDFQWLPDDVVLHRFASPDLAKQALREGKVQLAAITLDEALRLRGELPDLSVVQVMNESSGADVILARPSTSGVADLAGARIAFEVGTVSELLLRRALDSEGLSLSDIQPVNIPLDEQAAAYAAGDVDAVASYPPFSDAIHALGALHIFDSSQIPETIFDVLVVDTGTVDGREKLVSDVLAAHFRALNYLRSNRDDAVYRYAQYQGSNAAAIRTALSGIRIPAKPAVRQYLQKGGALEKAALMMQHHKLVPANDYTLDGLIDARYIAKDTR